MQHLTLQISARFLKQCICSKTTNIIVSKIYSALVPKITVHLHAISTVFTNVILVQMQCKFLLLSIYECEIGLVGCFLVSELVFHYLSLVHIFVFHMDCALYQLVCN